MDCSQLSRCLFLRLLISYNLDDDNYDKDILISSFRIYVLIGRLAVDFSDKGKEGRRAQKVLSIFDFSFFML